MSENAVTTTAKKAGQKVKVTFKTITDPARRRIGVAVLVGLIAGIFSGIIKFGWEVPFPPRTPERNSTNPPQALLEQIFGMSPRNLPRNLLLPGQRPALHELHHPLRLRDFLRNPLLCGRRVLAQDQALAGCRIRYRPGHPLPRDHHARNGYCARPLEPALR